jgi:hypothetical protein
MAFDKLRLSGIGEWGWVTILASSNTARSA